MSLIGVLYFKLFRCQKNAVLRKLYSNDKHQFKNVISATLVLACTTTSFEQNFSRNFFLLQFGLIFSC